MTAMKAMFAFIGETAQVLVACAECRKDYAFEIDRGTWGYREISAQEAYDQGIPPVCEMRKRYSFGFRCGKVGHWNCQKPAKLTILKAAEVTKVSTGETQVFSTCISCRIPDIYFNAQFYSLKYLTPEEAAICNADASCTACGASGIWSLPTGEVSVTISQKWAHAKPTVKMTGLDLMNPDFDGIQIQVYRNYQGKFQLWDSIQNPLIKRPKSGFKSLESVTLKSGNDLRNFRLYDGEYYVKVVACVKRKPKQNLPGYFAPVQTLAQSEVFTVNYRWKAPRARKVDMIVYRVVGGGSFGGDHEQHQKFAPGTQFANTDFFVTPHRQCAKNMVEHCDNQAREYDGGLSWAKVAVIRATKVRAAHAHEKSGHSDDFDRDEMILVKGEVMQLLSLDRDNRYKFPDEVAVNA